MWVLHLFHYRDIIQFDVQVLIHALQGASHGNVVLEFDGDFVVHERFEEAEEQHCRGIKWEVSLSQYR